MPKIEILSRSFSPPVDMSQWRTHDPKRPHLTSIISYIEDTIRSGGYGKKRAGFKDLSATMEVGFLWEEVLSMAYAKRYTQLHTKEIEEDGIIMSPDGYGPDPLGSSMVLEEYKSTWRSSRRDPLDEWKWMTQVKAYCYAMGLNTAVMRILYIVGDWKGSGPEHIVARIEFSNEELEDNWKMIVAHKPYLIGESKEKDD